MQVPQSAMLLRIFTGERDRVGGQALFNAIVLKARELHIAGATVLRGQLGYGRSTRIHRASALEMSEDLPVVVEIVDSEERIQAFLPVLDAMVGSHSALVTLEKVQVLRYGADAMRAPVG
jgi:PII-like signaling protein